jgi:hypothetical protein
MCVISTGDVLIFGGIIDSIFSSQFWLLKFYDENNKDNNENHNSSHSNENRHKKGKTSNTNEINGNSSKTVDLRGRWVDLRLPNLLSDEQIATNEHIALVLANNNQIMMEVNNQENGDDDDNDENDNENENLNQNQNHTFNFQNTLITSHTHTIRTPTSFLPLPRIRGETPPGRWGHTLIYYKHYIVLYGGSRPGCSFGDLWVASEKELLGGCAVVCLE